MSSPSLHRLLHSAAWLAVAAGLSACTPEGPRRAPVETVIQPTPDPVDLGIVAGTNPVQRAIRLHNSSSRPITVQSVEVSCECVSFAPVPLTIEAGRTAQLVAQFDPREDPDFRGKLGVIVRGLDREGRILFRTLARIDVRRGSQPVDGIVIPRKLVVHTAGHNDPNSTERNLYETNDVTDFQVGPPPDRLFTPQEYGIRMDPAPVSTPVVSILLGLAGVLAVVAIALRLIRTRLLRAELSRC
jgi:hypothetical protein